MQTNQCSKIRDRIPDSFRTKLMIALLLILMSISASAQTVVNSLAELYPYLKQDNVDVKLTPGIYNITAADVTNGLFPDESNVGKVVKVLLLFEGDNSTYDFTDVTINVETAVFQAYGSYEVNEVQILGNDNVLKNLTLTDVGSVHDQPSDGALNVCIDGARNLIEGFHVTAKGSFPYGYGDAFGKGGSYTIKHYKHSSCLIRGESNHLKNSTFIHKSYGHCIFMQAASNPLIEGCYVEGEVRSTDDMLAEEGTGSPADLIDFFTDWGYRLPPGYMLSLAEAGIRAYNAGTTVIDDVIYERGTSNPTVLDCTIKHMRTGVTVAHATGTKYVEGCTAIGCENGFSLGSGDVVDCSADCTYGPVYASTYETDQNYNADITILPASAPYYNGSGSVAYIGGTGHNITLRGSDEVLDMGLKIKVGGDKNNIRLLYGNLPHQNDFLGSNFVLNNLTNYPVFLSDKSSDITGQSGGMVTDLGTNNNMVHASISLYSVEAEDFSAMSGVTSEVTTDDGGGQNITSIDGGDWLEYEVNVPYSGTYTLGYRVATASLLGDFSVSVGEENLEDIVFPATGGTQFWSTVSSPTPVYLSSGIQTIRLTANNASWNINWIDLSLDCAVTDIAPYIEESNALGYQIRREEISQMTIFPGNTVSLQPEPTLGGSWSWTGPNGFSATTRVISIDYIEASDAGDYEAIFTNDCGQQSSMTFTITVSDTYFIEAESYSGMNGIATEATTDDGGGDNVTSIDAGDWVEYTLDIPVPAIYAFDYRVASELAEGNFTVSIDEVDVDQVSFSATGGSQTWTSVSTSGIYLTAGSHSLRLTANQSGWNINWLELVGEDYVNPCNLPFDHAGFAVQNEMVEWSSGLIDITCASSINAYIELTETGTLSASDYVNIYYKVDGGEMVTITENSGSLDETSATVFGLSGNTFELIIQGNSGSTDNYYAISRVNIVETTDPYARIEAEDFDDMDGVNTGNTADVDGGQNLSSIHPGEWSMYAGLDLTGAISVDARVGSIYDDAYIEVRLDAIDGRLIGTIDVPNTGAWQVYETASAYIESVTGIYDVYFVYETRESANVANVNWFQFSDFYIAPPVDPYLRFEAEQYDSESGIATTATSDVDGAQEVGSVQDGDWIMFEGLDFTKASSVDIRVASASDNAIIEVRLDAVNGQIISFIEVPNTGSLSTWQTINTSIDLVDDEHDVYFIFRGEGDDLVNVNWMKFNIYENSFDNIEAEDFDAQFGDPTIAATTSDADGGGGDLRSIIPGDWLLFNDVDLTDVNSINARFGSLYDDTFVEVRLDAFDGELIGTIDLFNSGGWHNWETVGGNITNTPGIHDVYFVFQAETSPNVCNINWFQLSGESLPVSRDTFTRIEAEDYDFANGTVISSTSDVDGEEELATIQNDDWVKFGGIDLTDVGGIDVRVASPNNDVTIEVRSGAYDGELLATVPVPNTGAVDAWETVRVGLESVEGTQSVYIVFKGSDENLLNINWIQFTEFVYPLGYYEAENYTEMYGIDTQATSDIDGDLNVGWVHDGDWLMFSDVDLTSMSDIDVRYSTPNNGTYIELRLDAVDGPLVSNIELSNTGGWNTWATTNSNILSTDGVHNIYLVLKGGGGYLFNVNWFQLNGNPFGRIEAEDYTAQQGNPNTKATTDVDGVSHLAAIVPNDWVMFSHVDLTGAKSVTARFGTIYDDAYIEVRVGASDGDLIGTIDLPNSGGWHNWESTSNNLTSEAGIVDLYFIFQTDSSKNPCNINWFQFSDSPVKEEQEDYARIEAESYDLTYGTATTVTSDVDGAFDLGSIEDGDWIMFDDFNFTPSGGLYTRVASPNDGVSIEVRSGSYDGELLTTIEVPNTGSLTSWTTVNASVNSIEGEHDLFLVFRGTGSDLLHINWLQLTPEPIVIDSVTRVQAEDYFSGFGVETETTTDIDGSDQLGAIDTEDNIQFTFDVVTTAIYSVSYRVQSTVSENNIALVENGATLENSSIPNTLSTWETVSTLVKLDSGRHVLAFVFEGNSDLKLNWIEFEQTGLDMVLTARKLGTSTDNQIKTYFEIANTGTEAFDLDDLTVRYWFTAEEYSPLNFWCDYAQIGSSKVNATFHSSAPIRVGGYHYMDVNFTSGLELLPGTNTGEIRTRFAKSDWTDFDESNDYSYQDTDNFMVNQQITVYKDGALIWGVEPSEEESEMSFEVLHKSSDSWAPNDNQIKPRFDIKNTGNTPVALSDIKLRYWFSPEGTQDVNFWVDWAQMGSQYVDGVTYAIDSTSDKYLELTFSSADQLWGLSSTGEIQTRMAKVNWTAFDETNDHSYVSTSSYQTNDHITLYVNDELVWGIEPLSGTGLRSNNGDEPEIAEISQLLMYPNPIKDRGTVQLTMENAGIVSLQMISITGKKVYASQTELSLGTHQLDIEVTDIPEGIYLLQVSKHGELSNIRFAVKH